MYKRIMSIRLHSKNHVYMWYRRQPVVSDVPGVRVSVMVHGTVRLHRLHLSRVWADDVINSCVCSLESRVSRLGAVVLHVVS